MTHRVLSRTLGVVIGLMIGAVSSFGQDSPVAVSPITGNPPVIVSSPVATKRQLLQKYVWSTLGVDGAVHRDWTRLPIRSPLRKWLTRGLFRL